MTELDHAIIVLTIRRLAEKRDTASDGKVAWWYQRIMDELEKELRHG